MPAAFQLTARTGHPSFLDLPWDTPLEEWTSERIVTVIRGISRHVLWAALPAAEVFHQVLEHRWFLSKQAGKDVGIDEAVRSYVRSELPKRRPERIVLEEPL
jgi:hypothetical protein